VAEQLKVKAGYFSLQAVNPPDGGICTVFLSKDKANEIAKQGDWRHKELAYTVPAALSQPRSIWEWKREGKVRGNCYIARPERRFIGEHAADVPAQSDRVFLVFVTGRGIVHHWRWEQASENAPDIPIDHSDDRFGRQLL